MTRALLHADDEVARWIFERIPNPVPWLNGTGRAIGVLRDDKLIAGIAYFGFNDANIWIAIAAEGKNWISRSMLHLFADYPFRQLGVKRLSALVDASNSKSRRFVEHLGFKHEATLRDAAPDGDQLVYRMLRDECRWLGPVQKVRFVTPQLLCA